MPNGALSGCERWCGKCVTDRCPPVACACIGKGKTGNLYTVVAPVL